MTARDRFTANLVCPTCKRTGVAKVSQEDGWSFSNGDTSTRVDELPSGFEAARHGHGHSGRLDILCASCRVSAWK